MAILPVLLTGCGGGASPMPTGSFTTSSIYAFMKAVQDESGSVTTTVQLRDGMTNTANYLYLSAGESLYSSIEKPPQQYVNFSGNLFGNALDLSQHLKVMASRDLYTNYFLFTQVVYGKPEYFATDTPIPGASPVRAYVDFDRSGNVLTGTSSIDLPGVFQIVSPAAAATLSRATPLSLTWSNVDATTTMTLNVAGVCTDGNRYSKTVSFGPDTGSINLTSADYFPATGVSTTANCLTAFILQRTKIGPVSAQFAPGGGFTGVQQRTVQFTTTP
jgi:hypothetical protein